MSTVGTTHLSFLGRLSDKRNAVAWKEFHNRYGELLYRYARRRGASHLEAEDVVQEVTMYLFKAMEKFEYDPARGRFRGYLRCAVSNAFSRRQRKDSQREKAVNPETLDALPEENLESDQLWEREWQLHKLRMALNGISGEFEPLTLKAFHLHVLAGCDVEETATKLGMSKSSVYQAKCRVLRRLKDKVDQLNLND